MNYLTMEISFKDQKIAQQVATLLVTSNTWR
jgi:hypothetical protein